jgi:hypothetical protein
MIKLDDSELYFAHAISINLRALVLTFDESYFADLLEDIELDRIYE